MDTVASKFSFLLGEEKAPLKLVGPPPADVPAEKGELADAEADSCP